MREGEPVEHVLSTRDEVIVQTSRGEYRAKILIAADGANSTVRARLGLDRAGRVMAAMELHAPLADISVPSLGEDMALIDMGLESILGFGLRGARLKIDPCVPRWWRDFEIQYRHGATRYHIKVENPLGVCRGIASLEVDGAAQTTDDFALTDDGAKHSVRVVLGERRQAPDAERVAERGRASMLKE